MTLLANSASAFVFFYITVPSLQNKTNQKAARVTDKLRVAYLCLCEEEYITAARSTTVDGHHTTMHAPCMHACMSRDKKTTKNARRRRVLCLLAVLWSCCCCVFYSVRHVCFSVGRRTHPTEVMMVSAGFKMFVASNRPPRPASTTICSETNTNKKTKNKKMK